MLWNFQTRRWMWRRYVVCRNIRILIYSYFYWTVSRFKIHDYCVTVTVMRSPSKYFIVILTFVYFCVAWRSLQRLHSNWKGTHLYIFLLVTIILTKHTCLKVLKDFIIIVCLRFIDYRETTQKEDKKDWRGSINCLSFCHSIIIFVLNLFTMIIIMKWHKENNTSLTWI